LATFVIFSIPSAVLIALAQFIHNFANFHPLTASSKYFEPQRVTKASAQNHKRVKAAHDSTFLPIISFPITSCCAQVNIS
jgi:hypothetical protein